MTKINNRRFRLSIKRKQLWRIILLLLLLSNIVFITAWSIASLHIKATKNELRGTFGLQYNMIVEELNSLIEQNVNGANIPEQSRELLLSSIAVVRYTGDQISEQLNKRDSAKLNMILVTLHALAQSIQSKQFNNYCHVSEEVTVTNLEGYIYLLDHATPNQAGDKDHGLHTYNSLINNWPYRSINELYSSCGLK